MTAVAWIVFFSALAVSMGWALGRRLGLSGLAPAQQVVFAGGLGIVAESYAVLALGVLGCLRPLPLTAVLAALFALSLWLNARSGALAGAASALKKAPAARVWRDPALILPVLLAAAVLVFSLLIALAPPAQQSDALCYHLELPKQYVRAGRFFTVPYSPNAYMPFFMEMLFTAGLLLQGPQLAALFQWMLGVLTAAGVFALARRGGSRPAALFAGVLFLATPGIFNNMSTAYVDVALACFTFLAAGALALAIEEMRKGLALTAGVFAGAAAAIKLTGLVAVAVPALWGLAALRRRGPKAGNPAGWLLLFLGGAVLSGGFWYARAAAATGNPFYPYLNELFGLPLASKIRHSDIGTPLNLFFFVSLPWNVVVVPKWFDPGMGERLSAVYLGLLPLALWGAKPRWFSLAVLMMAAHATLWFFGNQTLRLLFAAVPFWACLAALGFDRVRSFSAPVRTFAITWCAFFMLFDTAALAYRAKGFAPVVTGAQEERAFLSSREPSFQAAQWINSNLPASAKVLSIWERNLFYLARPAVREDQFRLEEKYVQAIGESGALAPFLRRQGFTHVLLRAPSRQGVAGALGEWFDAPYRALWEEALLGGKGATLAHESPPVSQWGEPVRYFVFRLEPS